MYISLLKKYKSYYKLRTAAAYLYPFFNNELKNNYFVILKAVDKNKRAAKLSPDILCRVSKEIATIPSVTRIVYDLSDKANLNIEWE